MNSPSSPAIPFQSASYPVLPIHPMTTCSLLQYIDAWLCTYGVLLLVGQKVGCRFPTFQSSLPCLAQGVVALNAANKSDAASRRPSPHIADITSCILRTQSYLHFHPLFFFLFHFMR